MWCPSYCFVYVYIIYIYIPVNPHSILVKWLVFHTPSLVGVVKPKKNELLCHWGPSTHLDSWKSIERNHQADPQNQVLGITCSIFPWRFPHWLSHIYIYIIYIPYIILYIYSYSPKSKYSHIKNAIDPYPTSTQIIGMILKSRLEKTTDSVPDLH